MLWICGPQDSGEFILQTGVFIQLSAKSDANLRHFDKVQFLVLETVQSSNSRKCEQTEFLLSSALSKR
jgi:hypothetical protein